MISINLLLKVRVYTHISLTCSHQNLKGSTYSHGKRHIKQCCSNGRGRVFFCPHKKCHHSSVDSASIVCMVSQSKVITLYDIGGQDVSHMSVKGIKGPSCFGMHQHTRSFACVTFWHHSHTHTSYIHPSLSPFFLSLFPFFFIIYIFHS